MEEKTTVFIREGVKLIEELWVLRHPSDGSFFSLASSGNPMLVFRSERDAIASAYNFEARGVFHYRPFRVL